MIKGLIFGFILGLLCWGAYEMSPYIQAEIHFLPVNGSHSG